MDNIRHATEADLTALVQLAAMMHAESPRFSTRDFSQVKTADLILALIVGEDGCALVAERKGQIVGMMGGFVVEHFFGYDRMATDVGLYLMPEHRHGLLAVKLVRAFETWVLSRGVDDVVLGVSTEIEADRTSALYERLGYNLSGYLRRKEL